MEASCQCGAIKFTCPLPSPKIIYICHCTQCRRQSASAFGMTAIFPRFTIRPKDPELLSEYSRPTESGKTMRCFFCRDCGSRLIHARDGVESVSVKAGILTGLTKEMVANAVHIWTSEAVVPVPEDCESWPGEPPDD